ncbi:MAG: hypothetical protein QOC66_1658 [Pseudonocardiales bacterium]|jgi:hypothetical protein|nr:hypothetical protein [Pseudonocardiales bacterium]
MSAVVVSARLPRLRVSGMTWVSWRQHRSALAAVAVVLGAFSAVLLAHGSGMHDAYHRLGLDVCRPLHSDACGAATDLFSQRYATIADLVPRILTFLPALLGAFVGAPLVARELESGTFRFAWTQGTDRTRWIVAKLLMVGGTLLVVASAFTLVFAWWFDPWIPLVGRMASGQAYEVEGTVFVARTLFGFALGAFLGVIIKRTVPAIAATLGVWFAVVFLSVVYLRPMIQEPLVAAEGMGTSTDGWVIDEWFQNRAGHHLSDIEMNALMGGPGKTNLGRSIDQLLAQNGIRHMVQYQPGSRFWHFQIVETVGYGVVTLLLGAATVWWVRRRTS